MALKRRRKAGTADKRSRRFELRLTEEEYGCLQELEQRLGLTRTEIIRLSVLKRTGNTGINSKDLLNRLDKIGVEMGRSGNNINQLARHAHVLSTSGQLTGSVISEFNPLFRDYIKMQNELEKLLRQVLRQMGR